MKKFSEGVLLGLAIGTISALIAIHLILSFPRECSKSEELQQVMQFLQSK